MPKVELTDLVKPIPAKSIPASKRAETKSQKTKKKNFSQAKPVQTAEEKGQKIYCVCCGCADKSKFYTTFSPFNRYYNVIPYCKDCLQNEIWNWFLKRSKKNEQITLHGILRFMNVPYIHTLYLASIKNLKNPKATVNIVNETEEEKKEGQETQEEFTNGAALLKAYMKNYCSLHNMNGYGDTYLDCEGLEEIEGLRSDTEEIRVKRKLKPLDPDKIDKDKYEVFTYDVDELVYKWGNFDDDTLIKLELEWLDWKDKIGDHINEKETQLVVKQVCLQTIELQQKRENGVKTKDEITGLLSLMREGNLNAKQQDQNGDRIQIGMAIKDLEQYSPLAYPHKELVDYDNYGKLIDTFAGGISKAFGKENIFTKNFDEYYRDYKIDLIENPEIVVEEADIEETKASAKVGK